MKNKSSAHWTPLLFFVLTGMAYGQSYPTKPVRIVVGFAAGGSVDLVARTFAQKLTATYGRQVIVDNRPGAASHIAGNIVAKAEPDGYTLLVSSSGGLGTNLAIYKQLSYNALKDLTPVALLVHQAQVLIVNSSASPRTLKEFIALAKSKPGQLNYGSAGVGGPLHMATELVSFMSGIKLTHVLYKGGALALVDLLGGQIDVVVQPVPEALPYIKNGRVRALGVTSAKRSASLPDVPTIAEAGVPGYAYVSWMGVAGPAGMPKDLTERISGDWNKALAAPDVQSRLLDLGLEIAGGTPEQLGAHMRDELAKTVKLVKDVGIPPID
jgi:tripartite-type tricarboxylate transporter receptor subunit TctC